MSSKKTQVLLKGSPGTCESEELQPCGRGACRRAPENYAKEISSTKVQLLGYLLQNGFPQQCSCWAMSCRRAFLNRAPVGMGPAEGLHANNLQSRYWLCSWASAADTLCQTYGDLRNRLKHTTALTGHPCPTPRPLPRLRHGQVRQQARAQRQ